MTFVLNEFVADTKILASKVNENFAGLQGDITDNYTELDGRLDTQATTLSNIQGTLANVPKGTVIWFGADTAPSGYLICNGSAISRADYADLFSVIGTTFGEGNGETTFNLPDLVTTYTHIQGSTTVGTEIAAGLPNITGSFNTDNLDWLSGAFYSYNETNHNGPASPDYLQVKTYFDASRSSAIYGNSTTVQPPSLTMLPCIKY